MHEQRRQTGAVVGHFDWLDARMADDGGGVLEDFHRPGVDGHAALRARLNETLPGLVIARRAHEAGCRGEPVPPALLVAAARRDLVAHAGPFLEPGGVVADVIFERASNAIDLVDLDTGPGRSAQANEQAHGPAVIGGKIKEGGIIFAADHCEFSDAASESLSRGREGSPRRDTHCRKGRRLRLPCSRETIWCQQAKRPILKAPSHRLG
jgi:hypothetical protein